MLTHEVAFCKYGLKLVQRCRYKIILLRIPGKVMSAGALINARPPLTTIKALKLIESIKRMFLPL